jgi:two-component system chemotaxis response regulator CheY
MRNHPFVVLLALGVAMTAVISVECQCGERITLPQESTGTSLACPGCMRNTLLPPEIASSKGQSIVLKPLKILLVEDSLVLRKSLRKTLESSKYEVIEANDGVVALTVVRLSMPNIIILDYNMPNKTGIECLKELKAGETTRGIPVMMCTSNADRDLVMDCVRAGATDYIVKPVKDKNLLEKVGRLSGLIKSVPFDIVRNKPAARPVKKSVKEETAENEDGASQSNPSVKNEATGNAPSPLSNKNTPPPDAVEEHPEKLFRQLPLNANIQRVTDFYLGEVNKNFTVAEIAQKANVDSEWLKGVLNLFKEAGLFRVKTNKVEFVKPFNEDTWRKLVNWAIAYVANGEDTSGEFERFFKDSSI